MANFFANHAFNYYQHTNLNGLTEAEGTLFTFLDDAYTTYRGIVYEDVLSFEKPDGYVAYFGGTGITFDPYGRLVGGTISAHLSEAPDLNGTRFEWWGVENATTDAAALYEASLTPGTGDDFAIYAATLSGNDVAILSPYADLANGYAGNDSLDGGDGDDTLIGGGGSDTLTGGAGSDTFVLAAGANDLATVTDFAAGEGGDRIELSAALALLLDHYPGSNPFASSHLRLSQSGADSLLEVDEDAGLASYTWRTLARLQNVSAEALTRDNFAGNFNPHPNPGLTLVAGDAGETLAGGTGDDTLIGGAGADSLAGGEGEDYLTGGEGSDVLDGGAGADYLSGGSGNDLYYVEDANDSVYEADNEAPATRAAQTLAGTIDEVVAAIDYVLTSFVENLSLQAGAGTRSGTGNVLDNILTGNESSNTLTGAAGDDTLDGGAGADTADFSGNASAYTVSLAADGSVTVSGTDGTDVLSNIEQLSFDDATMSLIDALPTVQFTSERHAAKVQAYFLGVLGREATTTEATQFTALLQSNQSRVWWYDAAQTTMDGSLMSYLMAQAEYTALVANPNATIVSTVYGRLTGQSAPQALIDQYVGRLDAATLYARGVANKLLGELYLSPKGDGTLGTVAGFTDNRGYLDGTSLRGFMDRLDAFSGVDISNLDAEGNLVGIVGVA